MDRLLLACNGLGNRVETGDRQQTQSDQQETGHGPSAERHGQSRIHPVMGGLSGPHIGPDRDDHADVAGDRRCAGAHQKSDGRQDPELVGDGAGARQHDEEHRRDDADGLVLPVHVGTGAFLDGLGNFLHLRVAGVELEHPHRKVEAVGNTGHRCNQCKRNNR